MLKHLSLAEMAATGLSWVPGGSLNTTFLSIPEIAPLYPAFLPAHEAILAVQPAIRGASPELRKVNQEGEIVDNRHDHLGRAGSLALELARELALSANPPDVERAAMCDTVSQKLYPDGLAFVKTSWLAEAGNTARVERLLTHELDIKPFL